MSEVPPERSESRGSERRSRRDRHRSASRASQASSGSSGSYEDSEDAPMTRREIQEYLRSGNNPRNRPSAAELEEQAAEVEECRKLRRIIRSYKKDAVLATLCAKAIGGFAEMCENLDELDKDGLQELMNDMEEAIADHRDFKPIRLVAKKIAPFAEATLLTHPIISSKWNLHGFAKRFTEDKDIDIMLRQLDAKFQGMFDPGPVMATAMAVLSMAGEVDAVNKEKEAIRLYVKNYETLPESEIQKLREDKRIKPGNLEMAIEKRAKEIKAEMDAEIEAAKERTKRAEKVVQKRKEAAAAGVNMPAPGVNPEVLKAALSSIDMGKVTASIAAAQAAQGVPIQQRARIGGNKLPGLPAVNTLTPYDYGGIAQGSQGAIQPLPVSTNPRSVFHIEEERKTPPPLELDIPGYTDWQGTGPPKPKTIITESISIVQTGNRDHHPPVITLTSTPG